MNRVGHRFVPASPDVSDEIDPSHALAIKRWTAEFLRSDDDTTITVSELRCRDAGCPLVETVITVFDPGETRQWKLVRPKIAVTRLMIRQTLATPPQPPRG